MRLKRKIYLEGELERDGKRERGKREGEINVKKRRDWDRGREKGRKRVHKMSSIIISFGEFDKSTVKELQKMIKTTWNSLKRFLKNQLEN